MSRSARGAVAVVVAVVAPNVTHLVAVVVAPPSGRPDRVVAAGRPVVVAVDAAPSARPGGGDAAAADDPARRVDLPASISFRSAVRRHISASSSHVPGQHLPSVLLSHESNTIELYCDTTEIKPT